MENGWSDSAPKKEQRRKLLRMEFLLSQHIQQNKAKKAKIFKKIRLLAYYMDTAGVKYAKIENALSALM
jgi:hypothetical protein